MPCHPDRVRRNARLDHTEATTRLLALLSVHGVDTDTLVTDHSPSGDPVAFHAARVLFELAESVCPSHDHWKRLMN